MASGYDKSVAPKEGKSAISGATRRRIYGGEKGIGSFNEWLNQGGAGGPVRTNAGREQFNINTAPPQLDVTGEQFNPQQMLANMFNPQAPGGGQQETPADQQKKLQMLINWMRESQAMDLQRPDIAFQAAERARDPVRFAQKQYEARLASDPWGPGGQFDRSAPSAPVDPDRLRELSRTVSVGRGRSYQLSPAAALASQGNNATNQWAQQGGVPGIDPEELKRLNAAAVAGRGYRNYF